MRILLTANASHTPPRGGATRSNLVWLETLAARGHECRVVGSALADSAGKREQLENEEVRAVPLGGAGKGVEAVRRGGIAVYSVADPIRRTQVLAEQFHDFRPDWALVSSEDLGQVLLGEAHRRVPGRVVYLAHTPQLFPFGPASWNPGADATELVRRCAAVIAIGEHTARYIEQYANCRAEVIHPPIYGDGPFENFACFDRGLITLVNPCGVKGIPIFLALAGRFPGQRFGALPGWGTTAADRRALAQLPNVELLANVRSIRQVLVRTRVLLMPSLWYEGFGLSAMEAMLHGIPVLASDSGGLVDAKRGTGFVLPVRPIERYEAIFDEHNLPKPVIPDQDIGPWADALGALLSDRAAYLRESEASRSRALAFVGGIRSGRIEEFLLSLVPAPAHARPDAALAGLSSEKRALLLRRFRAKADVS